jgi:valyl-tRNA synthetase
MEANRQFMQLETESRLPKEIDTAEVEAYCQRLWDELGIYLYDPNAPGETFSIDTPPPYVSASHLHVGHAMSYAQAEFIVRYHRRNGRKIFYPIGFDDNGLPTERYVEKTYKINKAKTTRSEFRALCLQVTTEGAKEYEKLWRSLGLSVDWNLRYSTIDDHCQRTSQKSFIELFKMGRIYRSNEPVLWDTILETSLAQADLETIDRKGKLHDIVFNGADGSPLTISTSRPELLPACVALYCNSKDERYKHLVGQSAVVPLFGQTVPVLTDDDVDPAFGTGLMMVCTFGDSEDVRRWKRDGLALRIVVGNNGRLTELAGQFAGLKTEEARGKIVAALTEAGALTGSKVVDQVVSVSDRSDAPVEFVMAPQWFIRVMDMKDELLERAKELKWFPDWMQIRLEDWIKGLKFDWNISRQRFYGVPVPVWFCAKCGEVVLADEAALPVDPLESKPPASACAKCGSAEFTPDADVLDTWMTSSVSPLINSNWAGTPGRLGDSRVYPMTVRVQAFEIIRTWLFYTLVKSHLHTNSLPWESVMISGWGLNENGKKISKRDLEQYTDATGYNRYDPYAVIQKFGADSVRYWAAGGSLGHDLRYNEKDVQIGRKLVVKLWNAARFADLQMGNYDPAKDFVPFSERTPEDRWLLAELNKVLPKAQKAFEGYSYHEAREATDSFFWSIFCDDYLELIKDRFWTPENYSEQTRASARSTLFESLRIILGLYAPFLPFVTEYLYQQFYKGSEAAASLHKSPWPVANPEWNVTVPEMEVLGAILRAVRGLRTAAKASQTRRLARVTLDVSGAKPEIAATVERMLSSIRAAVRTVELVYGAAETATDLEGVKVDILL